ncbi:MAG: nucleotidyl transferase AbiEii/AbiGii toxin family protein [Gemmataceae bacterium]|nr:nucleotidyl transferase AbiEii/AbiGii toxin family protein [Gemmataceae bacterium]
MTKAFKNPAAFKTSLEARLRTRAAGTGVPFQTLQLKFVMERLLARLFHSPDAPWLLKGGFAMDLRYRPRARTTKDIDLSMVFVSASGPGDLRDLLQAAAETDLGDFLTFRIGEMKRELTNAPKGGGRFPVECVLLGKTYAKFGLDVGIGDAVVGEPEVLTGDDVLGFAGVGPAVARAIPKPQQFAEKVHAYTFPWQGRLNTRTKDLVDLVLLIERGRLEPAHIRAALAATFAVRGTHLLPETLPPPPAHWKADFPGMATEAGLSATDHLAAFGVLERFWTANALGRP